MKRLLILGLALMFSLLFTSTATDAKTLEDIKKAGKIVVGVKGDYPPWGFINAQGRFEGWEIDLAHKLAEYLFEDPNKVEFVAVTSGNRIAFLESGKIDIMWAELGWTPERAKVVDYSVFYFKSGVQLLVKKGSGIKSIKDLDGKKAITIKGSTGATGLEKLVPGAIQIKFDRISEGLQALRDDRGVAFVNDDILLYKIVQDNPEFEVVGELFAPVNWGVAFRKGEDDIRAYVNKAIRQMYDTGFLQDSLRKVWKGQELGQYLKRIDEIFSK